MFDINYFVKLTVTFAIVDDDFCKPAGTLYKNNICIHVWRQNLMLILKNVTMLDLNLSPRVHGAEFRGVDYVFTDTYTCIMPD